MEARLRSCDGLAFLGALSDPCGARSWTAGLHRRIPMTFSAAEEPTRSQTTTIANNLSKTKPAPPPRRQTRVKSKPDSPTPRTQAKVPKGPKAGSPRPGSKTAKILALLKRPQGAGLKELLKVTGWQPHS